ncbi:MAG: cytochrome b [Blastomonas sp.]
MTASYQRYHRVAQMLHWVIGLAVIAGIILGLGHHRLEDDFGWNPMLLHKSLGITVFVLTLVRLAWRMGHTPPPYSPPIAGWQKSVGTGLHWLFYLFLLGLPVGGYVMSSAGPKPIEWFGVSLPKLAVEKGSALAEIAHEGHEIGGKVMAGLVILHVLAALYHWLALKDGVMQRMLPGARA